MLTFFSQMFPSRLEAGFGGFALGLAVATAVSTWAYLCALAGLDKGGAQ